MRSHTRRTAVLTLLSVLSFQAGCHRGAGGASFLSLFGLSEKPVVVALVAEPGVLDPFTPHEELRKALSEDIKRPVRFDLCLPIQLEPHLTLGFYDFALVSPACYLELGHRERFDVAVAAVDQTGRAAHSAVLVVAVDSEAQNIEQLKGKKVAFGPKHDARTHHAGLALLRQHKLKKSDLALSLLPVPGSLKHYATMSEIALAVQNKDVDAGFIDEVAFENFQEQSTAENEPARGKLRVLGKTVLIPETLVLKSPKVQPQVAKQVIEFLVSVNKTHPEALQPLMLSAYERPRAELCAWPAQIEPTKQAKPEQSELTE